MYPTLSGKLPALFGKQQLSGQEVELGVIVGVIDGVKLIVGVLLGVGVGVYLNAITNKYQF